MQDKHSPGSRVHSFTTASAMVVRLLKLESRGFRTLCTGSARRAGMVARLQGKLSALGRMMGLKVEALNSKFRVGVSAPSSCRHQDPHQYAFPETYSKEHSCTERTKLDALYL